MIRTTIRVNDSGKNESYVLEDFQKDRVEIGRSGDCDIVIENERVGRHHGCFIRNHKEWEYKDLDSTNGSWINGRGIDSCVLVDGREICLGRERGENTAKFAVKVIDEPDESEQNKAIVSKEQQRVYSNMGGQYQGLVQEPKEKTSGLAIASMVIGIISVIASFSWSIVTSPVILGILALLAILFSVSPLSKKRKGKGMAVAGLVCGLVALFRVVYLWANIAGWLSDTKKWF